MATSTLVRRRVIEPERLSIRHEWNVVHVRGEVDVTTAGRFRQALIACHADPVVSTLDLSGVGFFGAAGVTCFLDTDWPSRPHVGIIASRQVRRVLELCDLAYLLAPHGWRDAFDGWSGDDLPGAWANWS